MTPDRWLEAASELRLSLAHVLETRLTGSNMSFQALRREVRQATVRAGAPHAAPWLHGERDGVAVFAHTITLKQTGDAAKPLLPTHTVAIAEIDPPLFAGLRMMSRDLGAFLGFAKGDEPTLHPAIDGRFLTYAFDSGRVGEIFLPGKRPDGLGDAIRDANNSCSMVIRDSSVEAIIAGAMPYADRLDAIIGFATSIAREISTRARSLRQTPLELAAREAWQRLAASLGLSVDPLRWHIFGRLGDVEVSAMLDGSPPAVSTTFRARFRTRLAYPLFLRSGVDPKMKPGFPELDRLLVLVPSHAEARTILGDPDLRAMLAEEASTSNLVLDDVEIVLGRGGFAGTKEIAKRLQALVAIVDRMTPRMPVAGPFR